MKNVGEFLKEEKSDFAFIHCFKNRLQRFWQKFFEENLMNETIKAGDVKGMTEE